MLPERIYILGTIHVTHEENPNYSYEDIQKSIEKFGPDMIGVEIRAQDMSEENDYLADHYPPEMVKTKACYEEKIPVFGFDWRGEAMENRRIEEWQKVTPNLWSLMKDNDELKILVKERKAIMEPFYKTCTLKECQEDYSPKEEEMQPIQDAIDKIVIESGHQDLLVYHDQRERRIGDNILKVIMDNPDKRIMILTGMAHKPGLREFLKAALEDNEQK